MRPMARPADRGRIRLLVQGAGRRHPDPDRLPARPPRRTHDRRRDRGAVDVGQSTVSAHLKILAEVRFVLAEQHGTARHYRINQACVGCFPTAADIVMGRPVPVRPDATTCETSDPR